jgi:hypothetical protein
MGLGPNSVDRPPAWRGWGELPERSEERSERQGARAQRAGDGKSPHESLQRLGGPQTVQEVVLHRLQVA